MAYSSKRICTSGTIWESGKGSTVQAGNKVMKVFGLIRNPAGEPEVWAWKLVAPQPVKLVAAKGDVPGD